MFIVLRKLGWYFRIEWKRYTSAVLLMTLTGIIDVIPPMLIGYTIDGIYQGTLTKGYFYAIIVFWILLSIGTYTLTIVWQNQLFGGAYVLERLLRIRFISHLVKMSSIFFERNRTGDLMARATNDLKAVSMTVGFGILTLIDSTLYMGTILAMMVLMISWKLTLAALLPLPFMALAISRYGKKLHTRFKDAQTAFGTMNNEVLESVEGVRTVRSFVNERINVSNFHKLTSDVYQKNVAVAMVDSFFEPTIKLFVGMSYLIGLCYGGYLVFQNVISLGELVSFNVYLGMLIWPMFTVGEVINIMQRGNASLDRVNETLSYTEEVSDGERLRSLDVPGTIEFNQVSFCYPTSSISNLANISVTLRRGETLGIVGRTGSGKTTFVRQLLREYPLGSGDITVSGVPLQEIGLDQLRSWLGYVPQNPLLFSRTIRQNICFGKQPETEEDLHRVLEQVALTNDIQTLPDGLDTMVGEKGVTLSGGQKQRVSIARALLLDPEILLLDDALSAVDSKTEAHIIESIRREREGKTTVITTHRFSAVQHADYILVLDEGRIVEQGTHSELLENDGWYKIQFERQQLVQQIEGKV